MFGDTLLESSATAREKKRWPMATAFTVETIVAAIIVIVPLLSTGVIPVSARSGPIFKPVKPMMLERVKPAADTRPNTSGAASAQPRYREVVSFGNPTPKLPFGRPTETPDPPLPPGAGDPSGPKNISDLIGAGPSGRDVKPAHGPVSVSHLSEAQLLTRVEPVYPHIAAVSGIQGQVKLHAIISRDGSIQSLNVISGHPLLARAALEAVEQWRYRPYILNGEKVEVETFITVNFRRDAH